MNNKIIFSLSDYQRATLTEMGIPFWHQVVTPVVSSDADNCTKSIEINSSRDGIKEKEEQETNSAQTQEIKLAKSIPQNILLLMTETQSALPLVKDVLNALNLPLDASLTVSTSQLEEYVDYLLAWKVTPQIALKGTVLTTPDLSQLSTPEAKKQLWRVLQNCHLFI